MTRIATVLFDLDGTLVHSAPGIAEALGEVLAEHGRPPLPLGEVMELIGDGAPALLCRAFAATGDPPDVATARLAEALDPFVDRLAARRHTPDDLFPEVADTLAALAAAGLSLGLCTNKPARAVHALLEDVGIAGRFGVVIGGDMLPERKPSARPLLAAIDRLGGHPSSAVMVGDGINDVRAAHAAGLPAIVVSFGYPRMPVATLGADRVIDRFGDLPAVLAELDADLPRRRAADAAAEGAAVMTPSPAPTAGG